MSYFNNCEFLFQMVGMDATGYKVGIFPMYSVDSRDSGISSPEFKMRGTKGRNDEME